MQQATLPYDASRTWMQERILAGEPLADRQLALVIDPAALDAPDRARAERVLDLVALDRLPRIVALDSGIDPDISHGDDEEALDEMTKPIEQRLGSRPELDEPTTDPMLVIGAYERWLERYQAEALEYFDVLARWGPMERRGLFGEDPDPRDLHLGGGVTFQVKDEHGSRALRDAFAAAMRAAYLGRYFDSPSVKAAVEATGINADKARSLVEDLAPDEVAAWHLRRIKNRFEVAKAHHLARSGLALTFEAEMKRWANAHGSSRLKIGIEDGYRMNARYLTERLAREAPGFYAMPASEPGKYWASRAASPTEPALQLRRRVAAAVANLAPATADGQPSVEIMIVRSPPHQLYRADEGIEGYESWIGQGLPDRSGWDWSLDEHEQVVDRGPAPFEAVVVKNWLGRFHLIGAVTSRSGTPPGGIWAVPEIEHFDEDGSVSPSDPDEPQSPRAKRKPPGSDDDIPF